MSGSGSSPAGGASAGGLVLQVVLAFVAAGLAVLVLLPSSGDGDGGLAPAPVTRPGDPSRMDELQRRLETVELEVSALRSEMAARDRALAGKPAAIPGAPVGPAPAVAAAPDGDSPPGEEALETAVQNVLAKRDRDRLLASHGLDPDAWPEDLKLTEEQATALAALLGEWQEKIRESFRRRPAGEGPPRTEADRQARRAEMQTEVSTLRSDLLVKAREVLEPAQVVYFEEKLTFSGPGGGPGGRGGGPRPDGGGR